MKTCKHLYQTNQMYVSAMMDMLKQFLLHLRKHSVLAKKACVVVFIYLFFASSSSVVSHSQMLKCL